MAVDCLERAGPTTHGTRDILNQLLALSPEDEQELLGSIRGGNAQESETASMILENYYLQVIAFLARQYHGQGLSLSELTNAGEKGLLLAAQAKSYFIDNFRPCAFREINKAILRALQSARQ